MEYYEFTFRGELPGEVMIAFLHEYPFESFQEFDGGVHAYLPADKFSLSLKDEIFESMKRYEVKCSHKIIPYQNWNKKWESSFDPVLIEDFCYVRADFHQDMHDVPYTITINPKMAFGTAHHETTYMMIQMMEDISFKNKRVFDYGCGTGILSILAKKMGANKVLAIDYDQKSVDNSIENIEINGNRDIEVIRAEAAELKVRDHFDIILANINLNVLKENVSNVKNLISGNGILLISGILIRNRTEVIELYQKFGFTLTKSLVKGEWTCLKFISRSAL